MSINRSDEILTFKSFWNSFFAVFMVIAVTSNYNLLFRIYIGDEIRQLLIIMLLSGIILYSIFYLLFLYDNKIIINKNEKGLILMILTLMVFMLLQGFYNSMNLISIKYCFYFSLLFIIILKGVNFVTIRLLGLYFIGLMFFSSLFVIIQFLLLTIFHGGDLSSFSIISQTLVDRGSQAYVNPYGLGLLEAGNLIFQINDYDFIRASSFSDEPKYFSQLLLLSICTTLIIVRNYLALKWLIFVNFLALCLAASLTAFIIIAITFFLFKLRHKLNALLVTFIMTAGLVFLPLVVLFFLRDILPVDTYIYQKINSAMISTFAISSNIFDISLFGSSLDSGNIEQRSPIMSFIGRYGFLGYALIHIFLYFMWKRVFHFIRLNGMNSRKNNRTEFALFLIMISYYIYPLTFFYDIFTPIYLCMFILLLFTISNYQILQNKNQNQS